MGSTTPTIWAIVVGIDHYPSDRCLGGAVNDAEAVRDFLQARHTRAHIRVFTAACPSDADQFQPRESEDLWPTWTNIVSSLKWVIEGATDRDIVYFHYSGHGTRLPGPAATEASQENQLALVLFDHHEFGCQYLEGRHLASALGRMVHKGLIVTLVLDCCFSGGVARGDDATQLAVRYIPYNQDAATYNAQEYDKSHLFGILRDAKPEKDWLVDPDGYTILTACGPFETASEVQVGSVGKRGALSHYLLVTLHELCMSGIDASHRDLHQRLSTTFHALWPQQTPMRFGNSDRSFLGHMVTGKANGLIPIFQHKNGSLRLRAGEAQGVCEGDEFVAYRYDEKIDNMVTSHRILEVWKVGPFESELTAPSSDSTISQTRAGWGAKLSRSMSSRRTRVRLGLGIEDEDGWRKQTEKFTMLALPEKEDREPCLFTVTIDEHQEYVIRKEYGNLTNLAAVPTGSHNAIVTISGILGHLTMFKFLEGIENRAPNTKFLQEFCINVHSNPQASGTFEVHDGDAWGFTIENANQKPLYLSVINFRDNWEIINVLESSGGDGYLVVDPIQNGRKGIKQLSLRMEVPQNPANHHRTHCEDIIKIFVTTEPTRFPSIVLPPLCCEQTRKAVSCDQNGPEAFLKGVSTQFRGHDHIDSGEWVSRNFIIRTTTEPGTSTDGVLSSEHR